MKTNFIKLCYLQCADRVPCNASEACHEVSMSYVCLCHAGEQQINDTLRILQYRGARLAALCRVSLRLLDGTCLLGADERGPRDRRKAPRPAARAWSAFGFVVAGGRPGLDLLYLG